MPNEQYRKYVLTELKIDQNPDITARYSDFATRILWMDEKTTPGAFQMNCSWYFTPPKVQMTDIHFHDVPEILGFFGSDYKNPHDLGGEIEFWLEDEKFTLIKSSMIFVPAGMKHCPLILKRIERPIFHFTTVTKGVYEVLH